MRALISGGAGFLGSNLTHQLLEAGHSVVVVDDLSTGCLKNLGSHPGLEVIQASVCTPLDLDVDQIFHLACPASPPKYQKDHLDTLDTNYLGTRNMLELAKRCDARILFASTSEVYGDPDVSPQVESYWGNVNSYGPRSCYDEGKRVGEALCYAYQLQHGVDVRICRIFNTYGPRMAPDDGRVVSNFLVQALGGQDLTVYGEGEQTRSLCYVDDLLAGILALMALPEAPDRPVNLGNPVEMTILEIARLALDVCQSKSRIVYRPLPQDDPRQRCPDITRAQVLLGWNPRVPAREGMARTAEYFRAFAPSMH